MNHKLNRRKFVQSSAILMGAAFPLYPSLLRAGKLNNQSAYRTPEQLLFDLSSIPNFCSHEHWGSIESIGEAPQENGFRCDTTAGARPLRLTSVWDLFLDPYEEGWLKAGRVDPDGYAKSAGYTDFRQFWDHSPEKALKEFQLLADSSLMTGGFQCTRRGIKLLYGKDLEEFSLSDWQDVDKRVGEHYADPFAWYVQARKIAHFTELIRPVHPEFYVRQDTKESKMEEKAFTHTVMRVDGLLDLWKTNSPRRDALVAITGIDPMDPASWRSFIHFLFELAAANDAVGIKQLQAYRRTLEYIPRADQEVRFRGDLSKEQITVFQDWVMHECCKQAAERKWAHQVHVGTNNLPESNPLPLQSLARAYPDMNIVMIHCWPFLKEAGYLAKLNPNMYLDTCWLPVLNPEFLREALRTWLSYLPAHKIMMAHDSTSVEMACGSSLFTREILADALLLHQKELKLSDQYIREIAGNLLQNNAVRLYKIGTEYHS